MKLISKFYKLDEVPLQSYSLRKQNQTESFQIQKLDGLLVIDLSVPSPKVHFSDCSGYWYLIQSVDCV